VATIHSNQDPLTPPWAESRALVTRSGAWMSAATLERKNASRITSATPSTTRPADAAASSAWDSQDGPSRNVPVEMIPVAMTNAK
jgi:hypothetical protein